MNLMLSRPHAGRKPAQDILNDELEGPMRLRATLGDGYALVYTARGDNLSINLDRLPWEQNTCWWYDPRNSQASQIEGVPDSGNFTFNPPGNTGRDHDWVLVIDDANRDYGPPGTKRLG